ncbi:MAG: RNA polymerase sigma factor [Ktedonobacteraceae bacterium]
MLFSADDLRYRAEQTYPALYAYLSRQAINHLGVLKGDTFEVDLVVGHVIEQLVKLGLLGGEDKLPLTALDRMSAAQFYTFLNRMATNKAIDRLRKLHLPISSFSDLMSPGGSDVDDNPLNATEESIWGNIPFDTPEKAALELVSQLELRTKLIHCLKRLEAAPHQLEAIRQEVKEFGGDEAVHVLFEDIHYSTEEASILHVSQHKDHAHRRLRLCLQEGSSNLIVHIALRLIQCGQQNPGTKDFSVAISTLVDDGLTASNVKDGLRRLTEENVLDWHGEDRVVISASQMKHLQRYYKED